MQDIDPLGYRNIKLKPQDPDEVLLRAIKRVYAATCTPEQTKLSQREKEGILADSLNDMMIHIEKAKDPNKRLLAAMMMATLADEENIVRQVGQIKLIKHIDAATDSFLRLAAMQAGAASAPLGDEREVKFVELWKREIRGIADTNVQRAHIQSVMTQKIDDGRLIKKAAMEMEMALVNHPLRVFNVPFVVSDGERRISFTLSLC